MPRVWIKDTDIRVEVLPIGNGNKCPFPNPSGWGNTGPCTFEATRRYSLGDHICYSCGDGGGDHVNSDTVIFHPALAMEQVAQAWVNEQIGKESGKLPDDNK
ncbi:MAG TPA: hypothetical protein VLK22_03355 [Candidatus Udaeobacter sp.]|nr:hypothetical protein [Candidatus Udaeobacter sp.]